MRTISEVTKMRGYLDEYIEAKRQEGLQEGIKKGLDLAAAQISAQLLRKGMPPHEIQELVDNLNPVQSASEPEKRQP
jgi:hypothetical protein